MDAEGIIFLATDIVMVLIMGTIGIVQYKTKGKAVGFYSGEKPFDVSELTDVDAWNKKHGKMWIIYAVIIAVTYPVTVAVGLDSPFCLIPQCIGLLLPVVFMIKYHHKLIKRYKKIK